MNRLHRAVRSLGCLFLVAIALAVLAWYFTSTGPRAEVRYPAPATSPYRLPWPEGVTRVCIQGNRGIVSHKDSGEFSWDFAMPVGSPVCAARGGVVRRVVDRHTGRGTEAPNNLVMIDHGDGTRGYYLHLRQGGARVRVGQRVRQGEVIAESGNVGRSLTPHLHFHVRRRRRTIPISFADVRRHDGVPRMFFRYTAGDR